MKKFTATVATDGIGLNGSRFDDLDQLAVGAKGAPLLGTFGGVQIGTIDQAHVDDDGVTILGRLELDISETLHAMSPMYVVPGGILHESHQAGDVRVLDNFEIKVFALTSAPADLNLKPIELVEHEE